MFLVVHFVVSIFPVVIVFIMSFVCLFVCLIVVIFFHCRMNDLFTYRVPTNEDQSLIVTCSLKCVDASGE